MVRLTKLIALLLALAVAATACGSGSPSGTAEEPDSSAAVDASAAADDTETTTATTDDADASDGTSAATESAGAADSAGADDVDEGDSEAGSTADSAPATTCGYEQDLEPQDVTIAQIPGDDRDTTPSALNGLHPDFPEPLIDPDEIISGGPPPDGIPPIDDPKFQTASSVDWLRCSEPVLSLVVEGQARAYPIQIMTWHEIVNDTFGDVPVSVSFCPLCNSALVYRRDVDGRVLDFGTSGRLFNSSLVMYDRQTESLWTHFNGAAVVGSLTGVELELLPVQTTSWENFLRANPDAPVLTRDTGHVRRYGENPYTGYDNTGDDPFLFRGEIDRRLAAKERVVSIEVGDDSAAVVLTHLVDEEVLATEVGGQAVSIWHLPGTASALDSQAIADGRDVGTVGVYDPMLNGQALTFSRTADGTFTDAETGSTWDIGGAAIAGELSGERLRAIERLDTFWFAIAAFEPDTRIIGG